MQEAIRRSNCFSELSVVFAASTFWYLSWEASKLVKLSWVILYCPSLSSTMRIRWWVNGRLCLAMTLKLRFLPVYGESRRPSLSPPPPGPAAGWAPALTVGRSVPPARTKTDTYFIFPLKEDVVETNGSRLPRECLLWAVIPHNMAFGHFFHGFHSRHVLWILSFCLFIIQSCAYFGTSWVLSCWPNTLKMNAHVVFPPAYVQVFPSTQRSVTTPLSAMHSSVLQCGLSWGFQTSRVSLAVQSPAGTWGQLTLLSFIVLLLCDSFHLQMKNCLINTVLHVGV